MFSSFTSFSLQFPLPRFLVRKSASAVDIQPVQVHDIETNQDKRARTLKHLLKLNHANHAIVYHHLQFNNHMAHILGSAYLLGASSDHLEAIYDKEAAELEPWRDSPGEISAHDWRDYLGDRRYQRAYLDFFEDQLVLDGYDWKKVLNTYLFEGKKPLFNNLICGRHPLIHLGYAYELSSRSTAMEALGLATTSHNFLHKYLDDPAYTTPSPPPNPSPSPLTILTRIHTDPRLKNTFTSPGAANIAPLFESHEPTVLEHWNSWTLSSNPTPQFEESQKAAVALLVATHPAASTSPDYDFFLVHLLTTSHAVRILLPLIPSQHHLALVRQWWLLTVAVYIAQLRPAIDLDAIYGYDTEGKGWEWAEKEAREGRWSTDAHFVKAVRAMKVAEETWGERDGFWLRAAVKFSREFGGWGGFGAAVEGRTRRGSAGAG